MKKSAFQSLVRRILLEEKTKRDLKLGNNKEYDAAIKPDENYSNVVPHKRDTSSKDEILADIESVAKEIDPEIIVVWDDHDDISVDYRDMFRVRIIPKWENNYDIEAMIRNEDRVRVFNLTLDQVKDFIRGNFSKDAKTAIDSAMGKVKKNREDQVDGPDSGMPQKDKVKLKKAEDMEQMGSDEPSDKMKEMEDPKKQLDHKAKRPAKRGKGKPVTRFKDYQK